jgi:hypothetical protein
MKDPEIYKVKPTSPDPEKKKESKPVKAKKTSTSNSDENEETRAAIANLLQNTVEKYAEAADNQLKSTRDDFETLQSIISEFLEDYLVIGHTLDGQRVVIRYTSSPAALDGLTELSKKVLVRMMQQEQLGQ